MEKEDKQQNREEESVIHIPLPVLIPIIVILTAVGVVLYKQEELASLFANPSEELEQIGELPLQSEGDQDLIKPLEITPEFQTQVSPQPQQQPQPEPEPQPQPQLQPQFQPLPEEEPKGPCEDIVCPDGYFCIEVDGKCIAQPAESSYCGDGICKDKENRENCFSDCVYEPMEGEGIISETSVVLIYNEQLGGEWQMLKFKDTVNCVSIIRDKFKIEMPEPARTKLLVLSLLVGEDEKTYSYVNNFGIVHIQNIKGHESILENIDYFREQINEEQACLSFHELIHIFLLTTPIPLWASEGLATYADLEFNPSRIQIQCKDSTWYATDGQAGYLEKPYSDLSQPPGQDNEPGNYWYYTGYCFWSYIKQKYGDSAIIAILQELKRHEEEDSLDFLKDIVNKVLKTDITNITKQRFNVP